jgi:hypothetical protein
MSAINRAPGKKRRPNTSQSGTAAVEFALLAMVFFTMVFGIIEVSRLLYVYNTLQDVTRRAASAAARVYPDSAAIEKIKQAAIFRDSPGELLLGYPVSDKNIRLEYLALIRDNTGKLSFSKIDLASLPSCAAQNRQICMSNPNAANCIRFVRASICDTADTAECQRVKSRMIVPLVDVPVALHKATTITTAESLGYSPGTAACASSS